MGKTIIDDFAVGLRNRALEQKIAAIDGVYGVHLIEEYPPTLVIQLGNADLATMMGVLSMLRIKFQVIPKYLDYHDCIEENKIKKEEKW